MRGRGRWQRRFAFLSISTDSNSSIFAPLTALILLTLLPIRTGGKMAETCEAGVDKFSSGWRAIEQKALGLFVDDSAMSKLEIYRLLPRPLSSSVQQPRCCQTIPRRLTMTEPRIVKTVNDFNDELKVTIPAGFTNRCRSYPYSSPHVSDQEKVDERTYRRLGPRAPRQSRTFMDTRFSFLQIPALAIY